MRFGKSSYYALACILLLAGTSYSAEMKAYCYPEISMEAPASLNMLKENFTDRFPTHGCCYIFPKSIATLVLVNKFPDLKSIQNSLSKLTGVPNSGWTLTDQRQKDKRGWLWCKEYSAMIGDKTAYAVLGHGLKGSYLIILCADKNDYAANNSDYKKWRDSILISWKAKKK